MAAAEKYPVELKQRAVAMVCDLQRERDGGRGAIARVAGQLGVHLESLRYWVRQDDKGRRPSGERAAGSESEKDARIAELERQTCELYERTTPSAGNEGNRGGGWRSDEPADTDRR